MVWLAGGVFFMGADHHYPEEAPAHQVAVDGFWIDRYLVTNAAFTRFVTTTGYVTSAERAPKAAEYPGAKPEMLVPGSVVFRQPHGRVDLRNYFNWWDWVPGANWRHPDGPDSSLEGREWHPVVHISYADAVAYATWAGKVLPTEAEWEYAARSGLDRAEYAWGDEFTPNGRYMANTWQGEFPVQNLRLDGYERTSPVRAFPPNRYGLFDMIGNVWEWTDDWYQEHGARTLAPHPCCGPQTIDRNPSGGVAEASYDRAQTDLRIARKVMKGGSHLCAPNYCRRYRPAARMPQAIDTSTSHLGFRCIIRPSWLRHQRALAGSYEQGEAMTRTIDPHE
ncbi:MAG: formylglycine-generating enzyme family protein [Chloroflexi bacterium]|nr:formylglycine-generating enzyme family protein [Chloroflexota bacterium]